MKKVNLKNLKPRLVEYYVVNVDLEHNEVCIFPSDFMVDACYKWNDICNLSKIEQKEVAEMMDIFIERLTKILNAHEKQLQKDTLQAYMDIFILAKECKGSLMNSQYGIDNPDIKDSCIEPRVRFRFEFLEKEDAERFKKYLEIE